MVIKSQLRTALSCNNCRMTRHLAPSNSWSTLGNCRWWSRVWTLQEYVLAGQTTTFVHWGTHQDLACLRQTGINIIEVPTIVVNGQHLYYSSASTVRALLDWATQQPAIAGNLGRSAAAAQAVQQAAKVGQLSERSSWTLLNVMRAAAERQASYEEDKVYGVLGLLGLSGIKVSYGSGLRGALAALADGLHVDNRLLLLAIEWSHGRWPDGYGGLPVLKPPYPAWGLDVSRCVKCTSGGGCSW